MRKERGGKLNSEKDYVKRLTVIDDSVMMIEELFYLKFYEPYSGRRLNLCQGVREVKGHKKRYRGMKK